jgi:hypothetical protein
MSVLSKMIEQSGLNFLNNIEFEEKSPGRFFQRKKIELGSGIKQFYVILGPYAESPVHNHSGENMDETHLLLCGSGKFIIYNEHGEIAEEMKLELGKFHKKFSTAISSPNHKYIAGPEGSICLASEKYY